MKRSGDRRLPGTGPRTSEMESALSLPHPHWSQRERKNSLKRAMPRPGGRKRRRQRTAPRGPFRPHSSAPSRTCARRGREAPTCPAGSPADSVCPLRRDGGGGVGASRAGRGGAAPPGLPRDARALGAGNEEEAGGGSGGGAAAGTRARLQPGGRGEPLRARPRPRVLPGRPKTCGPASFRAEPSRPPPRSARRCRRAWLRALGSARSAPLAAPR